MDFDEKLIEAVKKHPALYIRSSGGYKNMAAKKQIWTDISKQLSSTDEICNGRWKCLRDRFVRECKKMLSESETVTTHSVFEHWNRLQFLKHHIKPRNGIEYSDIKKNIEVASTSNTFTSEPCQIYLKTQESSPQNYTTSSSTPKRFRTNDDILPELAETMECFKTYLAQKMESTSNPRESSQENFYKAIGDIIDGLQPRNQIIARAHILQYLTDLQLKELNSTENIFAPSFC